MVKKEFQAFCHKKFKEWGFRKKKTMYFRSNNKNLLCGIYLRNSQFGPSTLISFYFFLGQYDDESTYPSRYDFDLTISVIEVLSRDTVKGKRFMTSWIDYEEYTEEELLPAFEKAYNDYVSHFLSDGVSFLAQHTEQLHFAPLKNKEMIKARLKSLAEA